MPSVFNIGNSYNQQTISPIPEGYQGTTFIPFTVIRTGDLATAATVRWSVGLTATIP